MTASRRTLGQKELLQELDTLANQYERAAIAFDGDGTLWSGDIGEECFTFACQAGKIREEARPALVREAAAYGLEQSGSPGDIAWRLFEAYRAGQYPELRVCEMMIWCYAGWQEAELRQHVHQTRQRQESRVVANGALAPIIHWARARGLRCAVISASPRIVVEETAKSLGFSAEDVAAGTPVIIAGRLQIDLAEPVPYGNTKVTAGRALFADHEWVATFGDNVFDFDMLQQARLPVAVRPKPRLLETLASLERAVLFLEE